METNEALTQDQVNKLKEIVRQRFDELYHRIGTNRQKLATTVLLVHQSINKELAKEKIDTARENEILREVRDIEKVANNQLPLFHKMVTTPPAVAKTKPEIEIKAKPKPEVKTKTKKETKPEAKKETKPKTKKKENKTKAKTKTKKKKR